MTPSGERPEFSVVVPVFENASSIGALVERIAAVFDGPLQATYEIVLVDDGSRSPATWDSLVSAASENGHVSCIRLMRNYGKPAAVMCGLAHATGKWVVTIDDDLQQRPEDIAELAKHKEHDVVVAVYPKKQHGLSVRLTSVIKAGFDRRVLKLPIPMSPLKLIGGKVVAEMLRVHTTRPYIPALLSHATSDFWPVTLEHQTSQAGRSRYNFVRRLRQFSDLIVGNSSFMLRAIAAAGVVFVGAGFVLPVIVAGASLAGAEFPVGLFLLAALNCILGGIGLIGLGVIGEYLRRLIDLSSGRPAYTIREIVSSTNSGEANS